MPLAQAWKGRFRKGSAPWDYAARATSGKSARICNMWQQRQPSMSFVSSVGWMVSLMPRPGSPPLLSYIAQLLREGPKGSPPVSNLRKSHSVSGFSVITWVIRLLRYSDTASHERSQSVEKNLSKLISRKGIDNSCSLCHVSQCMRKKTIPQTSCLSVH